MKHLFDARRYFALLCIAAFYACGARADIAQQPAPERGPRAAALARLTVENHTDRDLAIAYRLAVGGARVVVGHVPAGATARVAPIVAGEPVVLTAHAEDGAALELAPRSFDIGASWTWVIAADAEFLDAGAGGS
ncbi:MAG TPA: hypothetical protein VF188_18765 [Longimicrobiales bacterium]